MALPEDPAAQKLLDELGALAESLTSSLAEADRVYVRRAEIYVALRSRVPPVKNRVIAVAARTTEQAVVQVVRKEAERAVAAAAAKPKRKAKKAAKRRAKASA